MKVVLWFLMMFMPLMANASSVNEVHHDDPAQQVRDDVPIAGIGLDKAGRQLCRTGQPPPEHTGLDRIQRQEGGPARVLTAEQGDARLGGGFVLDHDVLQRAAQRRLDGHFPARLHFQNGGHRPDDPPQPPGRSGPHHGLDGVLLAVHILFQLPQNGKPLPGRIQLPADFLLGFVGLIQRSAAVLLLQLQR